MPHLCFWIGANKKYFHKKQWNMYVLAQYSGDNQKALNLKWDGLNKELYIVKGRLAKKRC